MAVFLIISGLEILYCSYRDWKDDGGASGGVNAARGNDQRVWYRIGDVTAYWVRNGRLVEGEQERLSAMLEKIGKSL